MAWEVKIDIKDPLRHEIKTLLVDTYSTQNEARWWAVAFANRDSVTINLGQPNEDLIPNARVLRYTLREV